MKLLHVITDLGQGGAEGVLYRLIAESRRDVKHIVVSLTDDLYYGPRLRALGVNAIAIGMHGRVSDVHGVLRLRTIIANAQPDIIQTWMYHADLIGGLAARWVGIKAVVWAVRHSQLDRGKSSLSVRLAASACARLSRWLPKGIVSCSEAAARVHQGMGYCATKFIVVPNGYDLVKFAPNEEQREAVRRELAIPAALPFIGMVARWHPDKDHDNLLRSLSAVVESGQDFRCVLVGMGMTRENSALVTLIARLGLTERVLLAGPRDDIPAILNALDVHVLSSSTEAFPNTVAEAMACGTPCVCTNVGDAAHIVGDAGWIVPPSDSPALALGILRALREISAGGREILKSKCRKRIEENFALERMVEAYLSLWRDVASLHAKPR